MTVKSTFDTISRQLTQRAKRPVVIGRVFPQLPPIPFAESIASVAIVLGFSLWMIKPVGDWYLTAISYLCVALGVAVNALSRGIWLDFRLKLSFMLSILVGLVGYVIGLVNGNAGAHVEAIFFVLLPLVWCCLVAGTTQLSVRSIVNAIPFASIVIALIGILFWWLRIVGFPFLAPFFIVDFGLSITRVERVWSMAYCPISTLAFVIPFLFMSIVVPRSYSWVASRWAAWPALALSLFLMLISGRRVLFLSLALSLVVGFLILFLRKGAARQRRRMYIVGAVSAFGGLAFSFISSFSIVDMVSSLADDELGADSIRGDSIARLTQSWLQSPFLGHGLGAEVDGLIRSEGSPWAFEVQYHLVLNALGLVGLVVLGSAALVLIWVSARIYGTDPSRHAFMAPIVVGTLAALVANATNPYLHTPGHYWMLFLLVMAVNATLRRMNESQVGVSKPLAPQTDSQNHTQNN